MSRPSAQRRHILLTTALAIVLGFALLPGLQTAHGFGTVNGLGQQAEHERITRAALACAGAPSSLCFEPRSISQLAGDTGTSGAVGSPDADEIFNEAAHCDGADFLAGRGYPQTRAAANAALTACRTHLRGRFLQAVTAASGLLDDRGRIKPAEVKLTSSCTFVGGVSGRAKCDVIEGLGRALHGVEDFYSHSNWADSPDPSRPVGVNNPPGLGNTGVAPVMSLRSAGMAPIPADLATGCFSLAPWGCRGRITHGTLNKDTGTINAATGATSAPSTARGRIGANFAQAVGGAVAEARRQWTDLSAELVSRYGSRDGNLMICALTRDDPMKDCTGRRVVIVIDSSGSNQETDPSNLRISAGQAVNESLVSQDEVGEGEQPDKSAVVQFDTSASVISPLADPTAATFAGIDSSGGTDIGSGVGLAISLLTADPDEPVRDRTGIVVLTDGLDGGSSLPGALGQAAALGIRVNFGFLSSPGIFRKGTRPPAARRDTGAPAPAPAARASTFNPDPELVRLIAATGGIHSVIDGAENQRGFAELVQRAGLTNLEDPNGALSGGPLALSVTSTGVLSQAGVVATHEYATRPWRPVTFSISPLDGQQLRVSITDVDTGEVVATADATSSGARLDVTAQAQAGRLQADVVSLAGDGAYEISVSEQGVDVIGSSGPDTLRCLGESTYVEGGAGSDTVTCGPSSDALVGGPGVDVLDGGPGDDLFLVTRRDLARGTEKIIGGDGVDRAVFLFDRPAGVKCRRDTTTKIDLDKKRRVRLSQVEHVSFQYAPCAAKPVGSTGLTSLTSKAGEADLALRPPKPKIKKLRASGTKLQVVVKVSRATALLAAATVRAGRRTVALETAVTVASRRGQVRLKMPLPGSLRRQLRSGKLAKVKVTVVAAGLGAAKTKSRTVTRPLRMGSGPKKRSERGR